METIYSCRICRAGLFHKGQLSQAHEIGRHQFSRKKQNKDQIHAYGCDRDAGTDAECSSFFVSEPNQWMVDAKIMEQVSGKIECPKCHCKVGVFDWSGSQCSCGTWICPSFRFPVSKVDPRMISIDKLPVHIEIPVPISTVNESMPDTDQEPNNSPLETRDTPIPQSEDPIVKSMKSLHQQWLQYTTEGDVEKLLDMIDADDCSMTTIQKKVFDGFPKVSKTLSASISKLSNRITIESDIIALAPPSSTSRLIFRVDGIEDAVGESIYWNCADPNRLLVQHVRRIKNPSEMFLQGAGS